MTLPLGYFLAIAAVAAMGAFLGFDLAFRLTAWRTRRIVREEIKACFPNAVIARERRP